MADAQFQKRQTGCKITIKDILSSKYIKTEGTEPNYLDINSKEVSRVNILGAVLGKSKLDNYDSITIEDGSGRISAMVFDDKISLDGVEVGDVVVLIGKPREFSSEKYVVIEAIKKIDPAWAKVRNLELKKNSNNSKAAEQVATDEENIDLSPKNKIIRIIKDLDKGDGAFIESILSKNIDGAEKIIDSLLKEGGIFELKPGKLKVL